VRKETLGMAQKGREFGEIRTDKELRNLHRIPDMKIGQEGGKVKV
jgi:hypothetical protein